MTEKQAALTSFHEYILRFEGAEKKERSKWERLRWLEWHQTLLSPYIKPANKPSSPQAFMRFGWEKAKEIKPEDCVVTPEQIEKLNAIAAQLKRKKNG